MSELDLVLEIAKKSVPSLDKNNSEDLVTFFTQCLIESYIMTQRDSGTDNGMTMQSIDYDIDAAKEKIKQYFFG